MLTNAKFSALMHNSPFVGSIKKEPLKRNNVVRIDGRPRTNIDLKHLERLCAIGCTDREISTFFKCSTRTLERRRLEAEFRAAMDRGRAEFRISIRRAQYRLALEGNTAMLVWLGKQWLGQRNSGVQPGAESSRLTVEFLDSLCDIDVQADKAVPQS